MSEIQERITKISITPDFLNSVELELTQCFQSRIIQNITTIYKILMLCVCVIILSIIFVVLGHQIYLVLFDTSISQALILNLTIVCFLTLLLYFLRRDMLEKNISRFGFQKLSLKVAKKMAHIFLKDAKKMAPYIAEYSYQNDKATLNRIKDGVVNFAWARSLSLIKIEVNGCVLFFRNEKSTYPYLIIFSL